jgi:hypothetical protein
VTAIHLEDAYLCAECSLICDSAMRCACGNALGLLNLSSILNREEDPIRCEVAAVMALYRDSVSSKVGSV